MTQLFANNAASKLGGAVASGDVSLTLKSGDGAKFPTPSGGDFFLVTMYQKVGQDEINHEIVKCTARAGDVLTIERAQEGTTARAFSVGDPVELRLTAGALTAKQDSIPVISYEGRGTLRTNTTTTRAIVDGLGLFVFAVGSDEPDDDESCFATPTGRWLLEAVHWDVVDTWNLPDNEYRDEQIANLGRVLYGTATSSITSVAAVTQVSFTGTVTGAATTDRVIATPPNALGARVAYFARVTAANTVTVYINNPSAASQTLSTGTWLLAVFKES